MPYVKLLIIYHRALVSKRTPVTRIDIARSQNVRIVIIFAMFTFVKFYSYCIAVEQEPLITPCNPPPCGPNSQCRELHGQAVCSCKPEYVGVPPDCRPECVVSSECSKDKACLNQKCIDPCPGTCGLNAQCSVINHSPICTCGVGQSGDPFTRCYTRPRKFPTNCDIIVGSISILSVILCQNIKF